MSGITEALLSEMEEIGGCGDGGCMVHIRPGMHTNGGCRCNRDPLKMFQTVHTYKRAMRDFDATIDAQAARIAELEVALKNILLEYQRDGSRHPHLQRVVALQWGAALKEAGR